VHKLVLEGQHAPKFSRNLATALADPRVVTNNLAHVILLGRVAGPNDKPTIFKFHQLAWFQKRTDKFWTIFHISFPKSGMTSINSVISK
jgi:hypothetical protein